MNALSKATRSIVSTALRAEGVPIDRISAALRVAQGEALGRRAPSKAPEPAALLTQIAAARLLGVSRWTVRALVHEGRLKPVELRPGFEMFRRADVENFASSLPQ